MQNGQGRAGGLGSGGDGLFDPHLVDPTLALLFHPHVAAAGAAAEALLTVTRHFNQSHVGHLLEDASRRLEDVVVPTEVAAVVIGDGLFGSIAAGDKAALINELLEELGVMNHLELGAHVRVLVEERVEAVRAVRDHRLLLVVDAGLVEELDQALGEDLVQILVTEATGWVTVTGFHALDHAEGNVGLGQAAIPPSA